MVSPKVDGYCVVMNHVLSRPGGAQYTRLRISRTNVGRCETLEDLPEIVPIAPRVSRAPPDSSHRIKPPTWERDEVFPITSPIPVDEWLQKVSQAGWDLETLPDNSLIAGGTYDGGHVIMVHNEEEDNTLLFAIPPVAIPLLQGMLPEDQYRTLVEHTPKLSALQVR
jgi:hypothetical protein